MRERLAKRLAYLASEAVQIRFIVHGAKDAYLVAEQILDEALSEAEAALSRDDFKQLFSAAELSEIRSLVDAAKKHDPPVDDPTVGTEELIKNDEAWANLRSAARRCLVAMKFDLDEWEAGELKCAEAPLPLNGSDAPPDP